MSNLYMTTEEFAAMVVDVLDEQDYFKKGSKNHPGDIVSAFTSAAESIAKAMEWAISKEFEVRKTNVERKPIVESRTAVLPIDDEIAPVTDEWVSGYNEWKYNANV